MLYEEDVQPYFQSKWADKQSAELKKLMIVCQENLHHAQEFQKQAHNKKVKPWSYVLGEKVLFSSKYIKTKRNQKLEAKFFGPFQMLHPVGKQTFKLELPKKWRIHDVFYVSLLEQKTTKKGWVDKNATELDAGNDDSREYKVEAIWDIAFYARKSESGHLPGLHYLVSWKGYSEEENTWEPTSVVQQLKKLINLFRKDHPNKPNATSPAIDTVQPMARPTVRPTVKPMEPSKQKRG